jgi:cytochrome c oxidase subunit 3
MDIPYTIEARPDTGVFNAKIGIWLFLASEVMLFGGLFSAYILLRVGAPAWPHGLLNVPIGMFNTTVLITSSITMVLAWASMKLGDPRKSRRYLLTTVLCGLAFLGVKTKEYHDKLVHVEVRLVDGTVMDGHLEATSADFAWDPVNRFKVEKGSIEFQPIQVFEAKPGDTLTEVRQRLALAKPGWLAPSHSNEKPRRLEASQIAWISNYVPRHSPYFAIYFTLTGLHALHVFGGMLVLAWFWGPGHRLAASRPEQYTNRLEVAGLFWHFVDLVWIFLFPVLYLL